MLSPFSAYLTRFAKLHQNRTRAHGAAPHKPILLLAILAELDAGRIPQNLVPLTSELVATFHTLWSALVPDSAHWKPRLAYPFRYLQQEGFWTLVRHGESVVLSQKLEPSLTQLARLCDGGRFSPDLWDLLTDPTARSALRHQLYASYFPTHAAPLQADTAAPYLALQIATLKEQAHAPFRPKRVQERSDDGYFVRHRLFPRVVKELYDNACCLCATAARLDKSELVEAAHILPFSQFHNDDPRNGLALCPNHHWGFDRGAWSLTDGYQVLLTPHLKTSSDYLVTDQRLLPPKDLACLPDPLALQWHRQHWGFS